MWRWLFIGLALVACRRPKAQAADAGVPEPPFVVLAPPLPDASRAPDASVSECIVIHADGHTDPAIEIDGVIQTGRRGHPNGESFVFYTVALAKARCVVGLEDYKSVDEIQLVEDENINFPAFVGKKVHLTGVPFGEQTAWHARPVIMTVEKIVIAPR